MACNAAVTWLAADAGVQADMSCMHVICRAKKHCKLPADQVESLPSEEIYSRYMPGQRNFRVLKRDLGPLLQQVRWPPDVSCRKCRCVRVASIACLMLVSHVHMFSAGAWLRHHPQLRARPHCGCPEHHECICASGPDSCRAVFLTQSHFAWRLLLLRCTGST